MKIGDVSFYALIPVIAFVLTACVLTMVRALNHNNASLHRRVGATLTVGASLFVMATESLRWRQIDTHRLAGNDLHTLNNFVKADRLTAIATFVISALAIIATLLSAHYLDKRSDIPSAEFFVLLQFVCAGMCAIVMANDFMGMFLALEAFSIPLYVLTAFDRRRVRSLEAGFKYFIMGALSSAIFLYGIALHYGASGTTSLVAPSDITTVSAISMVLILVGLLFKIAAVPFHFWSPDAYQGAPSPVTAFMSAATKLAAFVALIRILSSGAVDASLAGPVGRIVLTIACLASAVVGSVVALRQANIKRAVAYSSISHTAYILLALKAGTNASFQAVMTYVVAYAFVIAGTFAIIGVVAGAREQNDSLATMKGLAKKEPYLAGCMTILLFSHAGMPLTSGFIAKFDVFRIAFQQHFYITGVIVLIATVIAAAFYLQIVLAMYADSFDGEAQGLGDSGIDFALGARIAIGACVAITMLIGVFPQLLTGLTHAL